MGEITGEKRKTQENGSLSLIDRKSIGNNLTNEKPQKHEKFSFKSSTEQKNTSKLCRNTSQENRTKCCPKCRRRREQRLLEKRNGTWRRTRRRSTSSSRSRSPSWSSSSSESDWRRNFRGSRSPSIPIDPYRTSPSHLELRRITSARKLPVPYDRRWTSSDTDSDDSFYRYRNRRKRSYSRK